MDIVRCVPPPQGPSKKFKKKYPFVDMLPGDSIFLAGANSGGPEYAAARSLARAKGWKFTARSGHFNGELGIRIWRLS